MRLHHLAITAFGPFAGRVEIDFDELSTAGLFLIRGATGAGKTSILDAICFALYADVPGARPRKGLHSDHAPADVPPEVTLDFTASGRRFRVTRSPEFIRPSKRANGRPVAVPTKVVLHERVDDQWAPKDSRPDDIGALLREVLGMGLEQFGKVVMLPQGDFSSFLRAKPDERRQLLARLFDVSRFSGVEDWLTEQRRASAERVADHRGALEAGLGRLAEALADLPAPGQDEATGPEAAGPEAAENEAPQHAPAALGSLPDWSTLDTPDVAAELDRVQDALQALASQTLAGLEAATLAESAAGQRHERARRTSELRGKASAAQERLTTLHAQTDALAAVRTAIADARRASAVAGDLKALARAEEARAAASDRVHAAAERLAEFGLVDRSHAAVALWCHRLGEHDRAVGEALRLNEGLRSRSERLTALRALSLRAVEELARLAEAQRAAGQAEAAAREAVARATAAQAALGTLGAEVATAARLVALRVRVTADRAALDHLAPRVAEARDAELDAREELVGLREARLAGMAGELAEALTAGDDCPVCGSREHPRPAVHAAPVTPEDIADAEERQQRALTTLQGLRAEMLVLQTRVADSLHDLGDDERELPDLEEALAESREAHSGAQALARTLEAAETALASARGRVLDLTASEQETRQAIAAAQASATELERDQGQEQDTLSAHLASHLSTCPCALAPVGSRGPGETGAAERLDDAGSEHLVGDVQAVVERHRSVSALAQEYLQALAAEQAAGAEREAVAQLTRACLADHGFATVEQARGAALPEDQVDELARRCAEHDRQRTAAETVLADPEVVAALGQEEPDLDELAARSRSSHDELLAAKQRDTLARRSLRAVERLRADIVARCEALGPALAEHRMLDDLADTFAGKGGNNALRMQLSSFVLAARLEKVVVLANERLSAMGDGRYRLQHSDERASHGARSGLGLRVQDLWTGQTRDTSSLSGGEAFMASLALALGLADAVREEAGGFDLQTLFVDEGFGTLDEESLEQVMVILDGLREGGRSVGVVSHVAELRLRIPCQITVDKTESGSSVRVSTAAGRPAA